MLWSYPRLRLVVGIGLMLFVGVEVINATRFAMHGVVAKARIIEAERRGSGSRARTHIGYVFTDAAGVRRRGEATVPADEYGPESRGTLIDVQYLPSAPSKSRLFPYSTRHMWVLGLCGTGIILFHLARRTKPSRTRQITQTTSSTPTDRAAPPPGPA